MYCSVYSIMGEGEAIGIVPRFAQELFDRVEGTADDEVFCVCVCVCVCVCACVRVCVCMCVYACVGIVHF